MGLLKEVRKSVHKASGVLRKDFGKDNEPTKFRFVLRVMLLLAIIYNLLATISNVLFQHGNGAIVFALFFALFIIDFAITYYCSNTWTVLVCSHLGIMLWVVVSVACFGWNTGIQNILVALLVFGFFSTYKHTELKFLYALFLMLVRMSLFFLTRNITPIYQLPDSVHEMQQFMNSLFSFSMIAFLCYIYSRDSQNLEGKLVEYNIQLVNQANTDPLTGLNNRRRTMDYLENFISDSRTSFLCVAICDIDFFKKINDTFGHDIGDKVLKSLAQTMISTLGDKCFISRWGGEEFLIVFPNINGDVAYEMLQNLRNEVSKLLFEVKDRSFKITLTYGLSEYDFHSDVLTFIKEADKNLYYGKENGRDQVVF